MTECHSFVVISFSLKCHRGWNGRNGALNANFLANSQKFKNSSLPAKVPPMPPNTPSSTTSHRQSTVSLTMEKELCLGCHKWFSGMEQHLAYNPICRSVINEHDRWQNLLASGSRCTNIATNKSQDDSDPILGIEVAACHSQPEDNMSTAFSMRHAKKQRLADCDDDQSEITYIHGGANDEYGSDGGWDNDISSKRTMEAVLAPEDAYVQMGDIICRLMVIPVIAFIMGDTKSGQNPCLLIQRKELHL
jgi:hypothetical protein